MNTTDMRFGKFVIVKKLGLETAILLHPGTSHDEAVNPERLHGNGVVVSAGYFIVRADGEIWVDQDLPSTSLHIGPRAKDAEVIEYTLHLLGLRIATKEHREGTAGAGAAPCMCMDN
jgi:hypothetical protein